MPTIYCKAIKCQWNRFDEQNKKHRCNKILVHIETDGNCRLAEFARPIKASIDLCIVEQRKIK